MHIEQFVLFKGQHADIIRLTTPDDWHFILEMVTALRNRARHCSCFAEPNRPVLIWYRHHTAKRHWEYRS